MGSLLEEPNPTESKRSKYDLLLLIIRQHAVAVITREQSLMMPELPGLTRGTDGTLVMLSATEGNHVILIVI